MKKVAMYYSGAMALLFGSLLVGSLMSSTLRQMLAFNDLKLFLFLMVFMAHSIFYFMLENFIEREKCIGKWYYEYRVEALQKQFDFLLWALMALIACSLILILVFL